LASGVCLHVSKSCDDGSACTVNSCDTVSGNCIYTDISAQLISAKPPNQCVTYTCDAKLGVVSTPVTCAAGPACTTTHCDSSRGCVNDAVVCVSTACATYQCNPQSNKCELVIPNCDDGDACTDDSYNPAVGCVHTPHCVATDLCTLTTCRAGQCSNTPKNCDDGNACTIDSCDLCTGSCVHTLITCACGTGNVGTCDPTTALCTIRPACTNDSDCPSDGNPIHIPYCSPLGCDFQQSN